jgi:hypothetical protein
MARPKNTGRDTGTDKTATIALPGGGTATVSEEWAKRWPEDVAGKTSTEKED